jgi:hypothetical protein
MQVLVWRLSSCGGHRRSRRIRDGRYSANVPTNDVDDTRLGNWMGGPAGNARRQAR